MIAVLRWWLALTALGVVAYPLTWRLCQPLPDRGLTVARPLGLLAVSYGTWLLVILGWMEHRLSSILLVTLLVAVGSTMVWRRDGPEIRAWLRGRWRLALGLELLFLLALALFALFRAYNPEIAATEKPMEFAFLNGVLRSRSFPPADPWLAGYGISYYYLGYVMMALLTRLSGVASAVGFNLMGATLFALTVSGAFGLGHNLMGARSRHIGPGEDGGRAAVTAGGLTAVMVAAMGNLEGLFELIRARGWGSPALWRWLDVKNLGATAASRFWYPDDMWWWWRASRVLHDRDALGNSMEVISEFPAFSFLLGDNHPHVLALPFVLMALTLALDLLLDDRAGRALGLPWPGGRAHLVAYALAVGSLGFLNTWDYPLYLGMVVVAYLLRRAADEAPMGWPRVTAALRAGVSLALLGMLLYLPFYLGLRSQAGGLGRLVGIKTRLHQHLLMFGTQVVWLAPALGVQLWQLAPARRGRGMGALEWLGALVAIVMTAACALLGWWTAWLGALLAGVAAWCLAVWWRDHAASDQMDEPSRLTLAMVVLAGGLVVFCEFFFLQDIFGSRMNTVFKFYYQVWVLLGVAGVHLAVRAMQASRSAGAVARHASRAWAGLAVVALLAGLSYTLAAVPSKADGFASAPTLDGTAYLRQTSPDEYDAIAWLQANARQDEIMVEAPGGSYSEFNRISSWTGIPTLLGWTGHELQWRGSYEIPGQREPDIARIYQSASLAETQTLLTAYGLDLVVLGPRERQKYGVSAVAQQQLDTLLERVYENASVVIYGRPR